MRHGPLDVQLHFPAKREELRPSLSQPKYGQRQGLRPGEYSISIFMLLFLLSRGEAGRQQRKFVALVF